jgi:hypothetical protein
MCARAGTRAPAPVVTPPESTSFEAGAALGDSGPSCFDGNQPEYDMIAGHRALFALVAPSSVPVWADRGTPVKGQAMSVSAIRPVRAGRLRSALGLAVLLASACGSPAGASRWHVGRGAAGGSDADGESSQDRHR